MAILERDADGDVMVRENAVLALFIKDAPAKIAPAISRLLERWLQLLPAGQPSYAFVGAEATSRRKVSKATRAKVAAELDPTQLAGGKELAHFQLQGPGELGPDWRFLCTLTRRAEDPENPRTNLVELLFPPDQLAGAEAIPFRRLAVELASIVPFDSGYAAPGLIWTAEETCRKAGKVIGPLALRHPGYDINDNDTTAYHLGTRSRGARWITFLGAPLTAELGGRNALEKKLGAGIDVEPAGNGVAIVAGPEPEIGDVNRKEGTPLLRQVARAIEPVTFFGDRFLDVVIADDPEKRARWERRLLE